MSAAVSRTKVAFAISHSEAAGAQAIWADLAAAFRQRGHDVSLIAIYPGASGPMPLHGGVSWDHCLPRTPRPGLDAARALGGAVRLLRSKTPATIFTALPAANVIFPLANRLGRGGAQVFTSHHSPISTYNPAISRLDGWVGASRAVDGIICVSQAVRDSMSGRAGAYAAKATVITNALPPVVEERIRQLKLAPAARPSGTSAGCRVVASGRLAAQKNYPVLVRAMAHVPGATLEVIGGGPDEAALRQLAAECGVAERITFAGLKPRNDTLATVAAADIFVQPSLFEGHSLALVEAAKLGLPLVVSDVPSQVEGVTRRDGTLCALLHGPHDHLALADAISRLAADERLRESYRALSASLGEEVSFSDMVDRYEALLPRATPLARAA